MEKFIFLPGISLDLNYIKKLVFKNIDKRVDGLKRHQRLVADDEYLSSIKEKFPFLSSLYNIYNTKEIIPLHIDSARACAFNIPIDNTQDSDTIFYSSLEDISLEYDENNSLHKVNSNVKEIFKFTLTEPTLIDNSIPHMVINRSSKNRIVLSWSVNHEHSFLDTVELFKKFSNLN